MMLLSRSALQASGRQTIRQYSHSVAKQDPKMHNATGIWDAMKAKRPIDADELHVSSRLLPSAAARFRIPWVDSHYRTT
jgi:hypothetical protein